MNLILVGLGTALLLLIFNLITKRIKFASITKDYPGPPNYPIIGGALEFGNNPVDFLKNFYKCLKKYGNIYTIWIGTNPILMVSDPDFLAFLLSSTVHIEKYYTYDMLKPWLGEGLLISGGEKWKKRRKILTPAYHFKILEDFHSIMNTSSDILIEKLTEAINKDYIDIYPYITLHALDVICETAMGTQIHAQKKSNSEYVKAVKDIANIIIRRSMSALYKHDLFFRFSNDYNNYIKYLNILHGFTNEIIKQRRNLLMKEMDDEKYENKDDVGMKKRFAFLDLLLKSTMDGKPLSDEDIREEVDTFMFEGHDTTASAMSFILYNIANHPKVQEKIIDEIQIFVGDDLKRSLTFNELNQMQYIDMVIKESLRLYPSVPKYGRVLKEDAYYKGTHLPKGLTISVFAYGLHRHPDSFPDPEKFDPERFSLENSKGRGLYTYVPFSAGQRNCIGQKFAMLEMKTTIAKILQYYELTSAGPGLEPILSTELVLKPLNGSFVKLQKRL